MDDRWVPEVARPEPRRWYCCESCGQRFVMGRPDAEAIAEREALFPGVAPEDFAIVCDDCFNDGDWPKPGP